MTAGEIITKFELQVSDITELSSDEELDLFNKVYFKVCTTKPWEFSKVNTSGTILTDANGSYIPIPDDFAYFAENNSYTDNTMEATNNAAPRVIFLGPNFQPYQIVNFSDRRQYRTSSGYAYLDLANNQIRFTVAPTLTTYDFDYIKFPAALTVDDSPVFPAAYHYIIFHGMAVENDILQLSEKARSYAPENNAKYISYMEDLDYWNANLALNN